MLPSRPVLTPRLRGGVRTQMSSDQSHSALTQAAWAVCLVLIGWG